MLEFLYKFFYFWDLDFKLLLSSSSLLPNLCVLLLILIITILISILVSKHKFFNTLKNKKGNKLLIAGIWIYFTMRIWLFSLYFGPLPAIIDWDIDLWSCVILKNFASILAIIGIVCCIVSRINQNKSSKVKITTKSKNKSRKSNMDITNILD